ncbi:hypothetical protein SAMN05444161_8711 [Rhizobiales bacterium GAS191]|nr:hypothetical protein SAMN05444161_8711 [Rhizobiales bacterium GAS191]
MSLQTVELETTSVESRASGVSWAAVAAGAVATSALTLVLLAFGAGMGFSAVSPWNSGPSSTTLGIVAGVYLLVVAVLASSVGGYIAGRLRTKWIGLHTHEVFFRDTAHGFLSWAFASVIRAAILASAATSIAGGVAMGGAQPVGDVGGEISNRNSTSYFVDSLLRASTQAAGGDNAAWRGEATRIFTTGLFGDLAPADRTYLAQLISARTGISQADADKRITEVTDQAKAAADKARKAAAALSLWLAASMLLGAFAASLAATEGGELRDRDQSLA